MDHGEGKDGNLFREVNRDMRELARTDRETCERLKTAWAPFLHYCIQGVLRCPTVPQGTVTWRARPEPIAGLREVYRPGYEVTFCACTSSTMDFKYACAMARYSAGTILQFTLLEGFQLDELSLYPREHEVLLPPSKHYTVSSAGQRRRPCFRRSARTAGACAPETQASRVI